MPFAHLLGRSSIEIKFFFSYQNAKVMPKVENIIAELISTVLKTSIIDFYEEIFQMIQILTALR